MDQKESPCKSAKGGSKQELVLGAVGNPTGPETHVTVLGTCYAEGRPVETSMLIDCGATGMFVDRSFVKIHGFPTFPLEQPRSLTVIDGRPISSGAVTDGVTMRLRIGSHTETTNFYVCDLGSFAAVLGLPWLKEHNPVIDWVNSAVEFGDTCVSKGCIRRKELVCSPHSATLDVKGIRPWIVEKGAVTEDMVVAYLKMDEEEEERHWRPDPWEWDQRATDSLPNDLDPPEYMQTLRGIVPEKYHDFLGAFSKTKADTLPEHRSFDHQIDLEEGKTPSFGKLYNHSLRESEELKKWIAENLEKGFIRPSSSSAASPVLFVPKKGNELRLCIDYRALNDITKKDRTPLPLISETLDKCHRRTWRNTRDQEKARLSPLLDAAPIFRALTERSARIRHDPYGCGEYLV
jgi:hypothetical protein